MKQLKSDLAVIDRKITAELADEKDGEEVKPNTQQLVKVVAPPDQATDDKKSLVAEPAYYYGNIPTYIHKLP